MTSRQLRRFKRVLQDLRSDLTWALQSSLDRLVIAQSADPVDRIGGQESDSRKISFLTIRLGSIDEALGAIVLGNFGVCDFCHEEIPYEHLVAAPWSRCCAWCEEDLESLAKMDVQGGADSRGDA